MWTPSQKWPFGEPLDRDGVVEVARVLAVDRHGRDAAEIRAAPEIALADGGAQPLRLGDGVGAVRVGNAVLADDDLRVDARRVDVAQHVGDPPDRAASLGRPPRQLDGDHLARRSTALLAGRDDDIHEHAAVERHHIPIPLWSRS